MSPRVLVDPARHTIRAANPGAEHDLGLEPGTNGTAAECRRRMLEPGPGEWTWCRADGTPATAVYVRGRGRECRHVHLTLDRWRMRP